MYTRGNFYKNFQNIGNIFFLLKDATKWLYIHLNLIG